MKKITKILLAVLSGLLLSPAFFEWGSGLIMFIALVPLLLIEQDHYARRTETKTRQFFWYPVIAFAIFNILTIWWVKNSHWLGVIAGVPINTMVMTLPFMLFHYTRRITGNRLGYFSLIVFWITLEYLYLNVKINFPWLLLGNAFANDVQLIQWYEITGVFGGTFWILVLNILFVRLYDGFRQNRSFVANKNMISLILGFLLVPIIISLVRFYTYEEEKRPYECVVLQPNIDPYLKFIDMPQDEQTSYLLDLARASVTRETDYIIAPETFINNGVWHATLEHQSDVLKLKAFLEDFPKAKMVIGAMTYKKYELGDSLSSTAKMVSSGRFYYDSYNTAIQLDSSDRIPMYHKSRLVAGAEYMPSFKRLKFVEKLSVDLGGITRSHGVQDHRDAFASPQDGLKVAPIICWESIFGEYVTEYVKDAGANLLFVITNDGWWGDTPGHIQHNSFSRLRAIETRRSVARSANTGISCLIDQRGVETARIEYWKRDAIIGTLNANSHITFYTRHGDYIARISGFLAVVLLVFAFVKRRLRFKSTPKK